MSTQLIPRCSQRQPMSCLNCVRRKIRCSKQCPCTSCIDRGEKESCRREAVQIMRKNKRRKVRESVSNELERRGQEEISVEVGTSPMINSEPAGTSNTVTSSCIVPSKHLQKSGSNIQSDAVRTLEFLTHGRQSILCLADDLTQQGPIYADHTMQTAQTNSLSPYPDWDSIFTRSQSRELLVLHQTILAWMHNVVHMPTFLAKFEIYLHVKSPEHSWLALYYALLCTTVYHADEAELRDLGISSTSTLVQQLYAQSMRSLNEANFMAVHTLASIQTICILLQVAYNLDQGDLISVLLSAAIRIAQSLGLHRLGPDTEASCLPQKGINLNKSLIDREVKKRIWWFLVRQDWLQIPFQDTFVIHASQFNTPMPLNCHEDEERMIEDGKIVVQSSETYTQTSYSNELHKVAVVIWRHHERVSAAGHHKNHRQDIARLFEHTLWADSELKRRYNEMPRFLQSREWTSTEIPLHAKQLYLVQLLSMAHKIHTVHRYFQLPSFQDKAFAFTQQSCMAISQKCIKEILTWQSDLTTRKMLKMWTVITHIITSCVNLMFASIFRRQNTLLYDGSEMQQLAKAGREILRPAQEWSSIARRGSALLDELFDIDDSMCVSNNPQFKIEDIIRKVREVDIAPHGNLSMVPEFTDTFFDSILDWEFT